VSNSVCLSGYTTAENTNRDIKLSFVSRFFKRSLDILLKNGSWKIVRIVAFIYRDLSGSIRVQSNLCNRALSSSNRLCVFAVSHISS